MAHRVAYEVKKRLEQVVDDRLVELGIFSDDGDLDPLVLLAGGISDGSSQSIEERRGRHHAHLGDLVLHARGDLGDVASFFTDLVEERVELIHDLGHVRGDLDQPAAQNVEIVVSVELELGEFLSGIVSEELTDSTDALAELVLQLEVVDELEQSVLPRAEFLPDAGETADATGKPSAARDELANQVHELVEATRIDTNDLALLALAIGNNLLRLGRLGLDDVRETILARAVARFGSRRPACSKREASFASSRSDVASSTSSAVVGCKIGSGGLEHDGVLLTNLFPRVQR